MSHLTIIQNIVNMAQKSNIDSFILSFNLRMENQANQDISNVNSIQDTFANKLNGFIFHSIASPEEKELELSFFIKYTLS